MDAPPSYDHGSDSTVIPPPSDSKEQPPSYSGLNSLIAAASQPTAISDSDSSSWQPLAHEDCPTLTLDGCNIYSAAHPSRILYVLSNPPAEGVCTTFGFEKVYYKTRADGEVKRSRQTHLYDFTLSLGLTTRESVDITGQRASKFTHRKVKLAPNGPSGASHFKVTGADAGCNIRVSPLLSDPRSKLVWKSEDGKELATETRGTRNAAKRMVVQPRLEVVEGGLGEKDMDFLVLNWCARVWREGMKDTKEPMTWQKFTRIAGMKTNAYDVARAGGFL